jgi:DeoR family transcriptional regulator, aga operon transcriptional repressor
LIVYERLSDKLPMNTVTSLSGLERQNQISQLIAKNQRISVAEICATFEVSEATARRDLEALASQGKVQRVHGGAIPVMHAPPESPMLTRRSEQAEAKQRIARAAAGLVHDGETIVLGSGSTVLELAYHLKERLNLTVITNSLPVMNVLAEVPQITLVCLGGMMRPTELSFIGHIAEQSLQEVRADKVIIGIRAINLEQGLTSEYLPEAKTDRALLQAAQQAIVLADHTKFGRVAPAVMVPIESVQMIITDSETPREYIDGIQERGIRILAV